MDKTVAGEENIYFEMESKEASDTGIYDDVAGGSSDSPIDQTAIEKQGAENATQHSTEPGSFYQSDAVMVQRLLYAIIALVTISFLTAAATLVLALTIMSQSAPPQCKDATACKNVSEELEKVTTELGEFKKKYTQLKTEENITAIWRAINTDRHEIMQLDLKVVNISKVQGPRGPPGYNGTQGPPGVPGPPGYNGTQSPPGGSGSGGLSLCSYKETKSPTISAGSYARSEVTATETNGKKFVGVNCGTNDAKVFTLSSTDAGGKRTYKCQCKDTLSSGASNMYCIIHYWECPA